MSTLVTKRPASSGGSLGITLFGGAGSLHATLADTNNATYAQCSPGFGKVTFATQTIPAGAVVQWIVLRATVRRPVDGTILYASLNGHTPTHFHPATGSGWSNLSSTSYAAVLSNAELADGVEMVWSVGPGNADISEAFLDITYFSIPTLNVTAPTGTIAVSRPTVRWDVTGDYPQERFRIKVFSSSQYSAAGFNPTTSSGLYDSGEQIGGADHYTPTLNLGNSGTYRFYVKVAQRVGSAVQWSAWDFTQPTVAVDPPDVPTLTVTAESGTARTKIVATNTGTPTWEFLTIEKTADGTNWQPVRSATRAPISGTSVTIYDYESGNGDPVQYRALAVVGDPDGDIASDWSGTTAPVAWTSTFTWLKSLTQPTLNQTVNIEGIPTLRRRIPRSVLDIAGRDDPVIVSDSRKLDEGTVTLITLETVDRLAIQSLLATGETLLLQTPPEDEFGSRYISCGDVDENRPSRRSQQTARVFVIPFNEVVAPVGEVVTFGITYDDVLAAFADYDAVEAAYPTYTALLSANL